MSELTDRWRAEAIADIKALADKLDIAACHDDEHCNCGLCDLSAELTSVYQRIEMREAVKPRLPR